MDENQIIFLCENSIEGIFSGVYEAWDSRLGHSRCRLQVGIDNYQLFSEYRQVETDESKAWKVSRTVCERLGFFTYQNFCRAIASNDADKADAVYKTIVAGFALKNGQAVMNNLSNPYVAKVFELNRNVGNEVHRLLEFLRFQELENGVLYARVGPQNDILPMLAPHFADRLPLENFMIYDDHRHSVIVHEREKQWIYLPHQEIDEEIVNHYSTEEEYYQELFTSFCHTIAIKERENRKLQQQMLPLKFQKYMTEFVKK